MMVQLKHAVSSSCTRSLHGCVKLLARISCQNVHSNDQKTKLAWLEHLSGNYKGIAVIHMNRPEARNAINWEILKSLESEINNLKEDDETNVLIVKSEVENVFCAGADLTERLKMAIEDVPKFVDRLRQFVNDLAELKMPSIAALDGVALGGGLEIALGCDIRVASASARLGLPETKLAIFPAAGGTQRLPRIVGIAKAKELIFTGRTVHASEAERIGLVNCVVDGKVTSAYQKSLDIAFEILKTGPCAVKLAKSVIDEGWEKTLFEGLQTEQKGYAKVIKTDDRNEGLKAFSEKRLPVYRGR